MSKFARKSILLTIALVTVLALTQAAFPVKAQKTVVTWFVGLGTGTDAKQIDVQNAVVKKFNETNKANIELKINIAANNQVAPDALSTLIAGGNAPDIVGPVGFDGANLYAGQWLDLKPLITKTKYDMKQFQESLVNLYLEGDAQIGIPFAVFPGVLFVNKDLFDEASLPYPPTKVGDKYKLDGKDVEWNWDTLAAVAKKLTVDAAGNDATNAKFDPTKIVQYGFNHQWGTLRADMSTFGGDPVYDAKTGKVTIPDNWRAEIQWQWNAVWKDHFLPTSTAANSDLFKPSEFASGKLAMSRVPFWYTCCISDMKAKWDFAVPPSYKGKTFAPADADTYRIMKVSKNPDAAFTVLTYLLGDAGFDLLTTYGAYPARPDLQKTSIEAKAKVFPSVKNWDLVAPMLDYATVPHHESWIPAYAETKQRFEVFRTLLLGDTGKDMDVKKELDKLQDDLQKIVDAAKKK